ncbi:MAG: ABC transporter permease [Lachnospiraceae bacterium]|nr:ABC transporter permease [Lachnospiraceae bacterium]
MKSKVFAVRTWKEIMRDPLSYIFCLGFPLVMLVIMSVIDKSIPAEAGMQVFRIRNLAPGISYFGLTFVMLFTGIQVSKDRTTALLLRLYASPMKPVEYIFGYTMPVVVLAVMQMVICFSVSFVIGLCTGNSLAVTEMLLSMLALLPSVFLFVGLGILFGTLVNEKAAPGLCSILISAAGMIGGIWMDIDGLGGAIKTVARALPFYHGVSLARLPFGETAEGAVEHLLWTIVCGAAVYGLAVTVFRSKMKKDIR